MPVLVHNNRKGNDAKLLEQFDEPAWNNPVVRYLNAAGKDLIPRKDGVWSTRETAARMLTALKAAKRDVPKYFEAFVTGLSPDSLSTATFAMHCYWEGEARLGAIEGVQSTRSGWKENLEVVTVRFDPGLVEYEKLIEAAQEMECASTVFTWTDEQQTIAQRKVGDRATALKPKELIRDAKASDQKYFLIQTPLRHLPLTELQATKINAALKSGQSFEHWLSPRQKELHRRVQRISEKMENPLDGFQFPSNPSELANYTNELTAKLTELESR